jgi:drug/metabolite transporter (DMT)-like permease
MSPTLKAQCQMQFCVVLWGFTAILGKLITLPALPLVWWRMLIVVVALMFMPSVWRGLREVPPKLIAAYAGNGALLSLHWLTFYGAIKLANASVAATCIAIGPALLALIEPPIARRPFDPRELLLGIAMIPGVALVVGGVPQGMQLGVFVGVISASTVAVFGAINKRLVEHVDAPLITLLELGAGVVFLIPVAPLLGQPLPLLTLPDVHDGLLLLALALGCTLLPFTLYLVALRHMTGFAAQVAVNLEPVYTVILAVLLLGEQRELGRAFYCGVAIIVSSVLAQPLLRRRG